MHKEVRWSDESIVDLNNIVDYLLYIWNETIVDRFVTNLDEFIDRICQNSRSFPMINPTEKIRKCVISKHNSIYYVDELEYIEILRVFDNRQNPLRLDFLK